MNQARQTFVNRSGWPIYISVEWAPECYELEPGDSLTLIYPVPAEGEAMEIGFMNERELVIWPTGDEPTVLINGRSAEGRSWKFKHP